MRDFWVRLIYGAMRLFGRMPLRFHYFWSGCIAWTLKNIIHYRKEVIYTNISRSFPELRYAEVKKVADSFYSHLGDVFAEAIWFAGSDSSRIRRSRICTIDNLGELSSMYDRGRGVIIMNSHCGNWELIGGFFDYNYSATENYSFTSDELFVVYRQLKNPVWNEVFKKNRAHLIKDYKGMLESSEVLRFTLRNKDRNYVYTYPTDQFPYAAAYDIGPFMHQNTKVMLGASGVAHKLGMGVTYMKMKHVSRGHYEISFIPICENASEISAEEITRRYFDLLEEEIRETPYNWLWSHKRWK